MFLPVYINASDRFPAFQALYDSGAVTSLITTSDFQKLRDAGNVVRKLDCPVTECLTGPEGSRIPTQGVFTISAIFLGRQAICPFVVTGALAHTIIGMNIISQIGIAMNPISRELYLVKRMHLSEVKLDSTTQPKWVARARANTRIDPYTGQLTGCYIQDEVSGERLVGEVDMIIDCGLLAVAVRTTAHGTCKISPPQR